MAKKKPRNGGGTHTKKPRSTAQVFAKLAEVGGLTRKQVGAVFDGLTSLIRKDLGRHCPGVFTIPGLMKIKVARKPATKSRKGINSFTGEEMMFKAKPARNVVKIEALKYLKNMVD